MLLPAGIHHLERVVAMAESQGVSVKKEVVVLTTGSLVFPGVSTKV